MSNDPRKQFSKNWRAKTPPCYDAKRNDDIALANNFIKKLVFRMDNVDIIELDLFKGIIFLFQE